MPMPFNLSIPRRTRSNSNSSTHQPQSHNNNTLGFRRLRSFYLSPSPTKTEFAIGTLSPSASGSFSGGSASGAGTSTPSTPQSAVFPPIHLQSTPRHHATPTTAHPASSSGSGTHLNNAQGLTPDSCSERTLRESHGTPGGFQQHCKRKVSSRSLYMDRETGLDAPSGPSDGRMSIMSGRLETQTGGGILSRGMGCCRLSRRRMSGTCLMICVIAVSLLFVGCLALSFVGATSGGGSGDGGTLKKLLEEVAANDPGIILLAENFDVDIDEPSVDIRWSILACGEGFALADSTESACGLPREAIHILLDGQITPVATYDPTLIPYARATGRRQSIESLAKFTTSHTLDVRSARLYPFDKYTLSINIRAVRATNASSDSLEGLLMNETSVAGSAMRIAKVLTLGSTGKFEVELSDTESYLVRVPSSQEGNQDSASQPTSTASQANSTSGGDQTASLAITSASTSSSTQILLAPSSTSSTVSSPQSPRRRRELPNPTAINSNTLPSSTISSRQIDIHISRPVSAQFFTLLLFAIAWILVHISVVLFVVLRRSLGLWSQWHANSGGSIRKLGCSALLLVAMLGTVTLLRKSMPDAPGFDGVLLDCVGFFPQVVILGSLIVAVLFTLAAQHIDEGCLSTGTPERPDRPAGHEGQSWFSRDHTAYHHRGGSHPGSGDYYNHHHHQDPVSLDSPLRLAEDALHRRQRGLRNHHNHPNHCCRASIISSFPQPPSTTPTPGSHPLSHSPFSPLSTTSFARTATCTRPPLQPAGHSHSHTCTLSSSSEASLTTSSQCCSSTAGHLPGSSSNGSGGSSSASGLPSPMMSAPTSPTSPTMSFSAMQRSSVAAGRGSLAGGGSTTPSFGGFASAFWSHGPASSSASSPPSSPRIGQVPRLASRKFLNKNKKVVGSTSDSAGSGSGGLNSRSGSGGSSVGDVEMVLRRKESSVGEMGLGLGTEEVSRWSDHEDD